MFSSFFTVESLPRRTNTPLSRLKTRARAPIFLRLFKSLKSFRHAAPKSDTQNRTPLLEIVVTRFRNENKNRFTKLTDQREHDFREFEPRTEGTSIYERNWTFSRLTLSVSLLYLYTEADQLRAAIDRNSSAKSYPVVRIGGSENPPPGTV